MSGFKISGENEKISSINRTIRIKPEIYDKLMDLSVKHGISFNKLVGQCLQYALDNLDEEKND